MRIVAIDPGGTTGIVRMDLAENPDDNTITWKQLAGQHHLDLWHYLDDCKFGTPADSLVVICERWDKRPNETTEFAELRPSNEMIGIVKGWYQAHKVALILQGASDAKNWATNEKLRALGLLISPPTTKEHRHANDAMRHLVYFICNYKGILTNVRNRGRMTLTRRYMMDRLKELVMNS